MKIYLNHVGMDFFGFDESWISNCVKIKAKWSSIWVQIKFQLNFSFVNNKLT